MTSSACRDHENRTKGCAGCNRISAAYERRRRRMKQAGTWKPRVPREQVEAHIAALLDDGANLPGIAAAAGLPKRTLDSMSRHSWLLGDTAAAILAVEKAPAVLPANRVPVAGAARRVQALVALGWSLTEQARRLGWAKQRLGEIVNGRRGSVTPSTAEAIAGLFEQLCTSVGGSPRAAEYARRRGWLPPLAWDDIDSPEAEPEFGEYDDGLVDEVIVERALAGEDVDLTDAELVAALQLGQARGVGLVTLAEMLHLNHVAAKRMVTGELTPARAKRAVIVAALVERPDASTRQIATDLGMNKAAVARVRAEITARRSLIAS